MAYNNRSSFYSFYLCLSLVLVFIFFEVDSYTPGARWAHSSVLIEDKLYFFGGLSYPSHCMLCLESCCLVYAYCIEGQKAASADLDIANYCKSKEDECV